MIGKLKVECPQCPWRGEFGLEGKILQEHQEKCLCTGRSIVLNKTQRKNLKKRQKRKEEGKNASSSAIVPIGVDAEDEKKEDRMKARIKAFMDKALSSEEKKEGTKMELSAAGILLHKIVYNQLLSVGLDDESKFTIPISRSFDATRKRGCLIDAFVVLASQNPSTNPFIDEVLSFYLTRARLEWERKTVSAFLTELFRVAGLLPRDTDLLAVYMKAIRILLHQEKNSLDEISWSSLLPAFFHNTTECKNMAFDGLSIFTWIFQRMSEATSTYLISHEYKIDELIYKWMRASDSETNAQLTLSLLATKGDPEWRSVWVDKWRDRRDLMIFFVFVLSQLCHNSLWSLHTVHLAFKAIFNVYLESSDKVKFVLKDHRPLLNDLMNYLQSKNCRDPEKPLLFMMRVSMFSLEAEEELVLHHGFVDILLDVIHHKTKELSIDFICEIKDKLTEMMIRPQYIRLAQKWIDAMNTSVENTKKSVHVKK